jgi:macrolide-specific efflux system membrane fusion protein
MVWSAEKGGGIQVKSTQPLKAMAIWGIFACMLFLAACHRSDAQAAGERVTVIRTSLSSTVTASGTVKPQVGAEVKVGPRVSGLLERLYVKVGDSVTKGQVLAELEHSDLDAAVRDAQAAVRAAKAQCDLATSEYDRRLKLAREGIVSAEDLEVSQKGMESDEAMLQSARTRLDSAQITQSYATIHAPIRGTVTAISTQEGETVAASFAVPTFVTIMDLSRLQVDAYVDEVDIGKVKPGQKAIFTVDAYPAQTFEGHVQAVIPQAIVRNNVVNYVLLIGIDSANETLLRPEMTASVSIETGEQRDALVLPSRAIQHDVQGNSFVTVLEEGKAIKRPVDAGEESGDVTRIRSGLAEGDQVLVPAAKDSQ